MGDHDLIGTGQSFNAKPEHRWRAECACGAFCFAPTQDAAKAAHQAHFDRERAREVGREGLAAARQVLEEGRGE